MQKSANRFNLKPAAKPLNREIERKTPITREIAVPKTSPTLVEFHARNSQIPEWRVKLQNAVRQRRQINSETTGNSPERVAAKPQPDPTKNVETKTAKGDCGLSSVRENIDNKFLSNALKRIESSRARYLSAEAIAKERATASEKDGKDYPFRIAARTENPKGTGSPGQQGTGPTPVAKDRLKRIKSLYDTSELDPEFVPAKVSSSFGKGEDPETRSDTRIKAEAEALPNEASSESSADPEEYEDYAPFALRFNAGVFDAIIGIFMSLVLLFPFVLAGGEWFSYPGLGVLAVTCLVVMFLYLTISVGMFGKSFGMHLFSLEMIDIGGDTYPSFRQSAVSASVYLLSMGLLGLGFLSALFDEERRAVHDLVSGTLVVREI